MTFNRPNKLNAINLEMFEQIREIYRLDELAGVKVLIQKGEGRAFCAGGDVVNHRERIESGEKDFIERLFAMCYRDTLFVSQLHSHQISIFDGHVMGAGVGQSSSSQFKVSTENTIYAMPENKIGYFTDQGSTYHHSRLSSGRGVGAWIGLTAAFIRAKDTVSLGLSTHYVPRSNLESLELEINDNPDKLDSIVEYYSEECPPADEFPNYEKIKH